MREQKTGINQNRGGCTEETPWLWKIAGMRGIVVTLILLLGKPFTLSVKAEPATLRSSDATVYEQTSEGSNPVGNLVEGGSFEYIGDVTAEDGSVWHQVQTASGATGYIKGDKEIETGEPTPEGGQASPEGERGDGGEAGQPTEEAHPDEEEAEQNSPGEGEETGQNPGEAEAGTAREEPEGESEEEGEDGDGEVLEGNEGEDLGEDGAVSVFHMQNNQAKKYVGERSQKVKERENAAQLDIDRETKAGRRAGIDFPLIAGIIVVLCCSEVIHICWKRMRRMKRGAGEAVSAAQDSNKTKAHRKAEKKKHSQKKKSTRIIQGKKRN